MFREGMISLSSSQAHPFHGTGSHVVSPGLAQALPACAVANALGLAFLVGPLVCSPTQLQCAYLKGMGSSPDLGGFSLCPGLGRVLWRGDPPAAGLALP